MLICFNKFILYSEAKCEILVIALTYVRKTKYGSIKHLYGYPLFCRADDKSDYIIQVKKVNIKGQKMIKRT